MKIERGIQSLYQQTQELLAEVADNGGVAAYADQFKALAEQVAELRKRQDELSKQQENNEAAAHLMAEIRETLAGTPVRLAVWDEDIIRQLVEMVKVISVNKIIVHLKGGIVVEQEI